MENEYMEITFDFIIYYKIKKRTLLKEFNKEYKKLLNHEYSEYTEKEAVRQFDIFLDKYPAFVGSFDEYIGDIISSDREAAAFILALDNFIGE